MNKWSNTWESIDLLVEPGTITDKIIWSTYFSTVSKLKKGLDVFILNVSFWIWKRWSITDLESPTKGKIRIMISFLRLLFADQNITQMWILVYL